MLIRCVARSEPLMVLKATREQSLILPNSFQQVLGIQGVRETMISQPQIEATNYVCILDSRPETSGPSQWRSTGRDNDVHLLSHIFI